MFCIENEIQTTKAWSFLGVSKETVERYFQLFQDSYTPSKARLVYIAELKEKLGEEEFFKISSKRSINPPSGTVFDLFTKYSKKFGSANGPDSFVKSSEETAIFGQKRLILVLYDPLFKENFRRLSLFHLRFFGKNDFPLRV